MIILNPKDKAYIIRQDHPDEVCHKNYNRILPSLRLKVLQAGTLRRIREVSLDGKSQCKSYWNGPKYIMLSLWWINIGTYQHLKDSLAKPLLVLNKSLHKDALKCFKCLQRIMGEKSSGKGYHPAEDIQQILERGIMQGELRDEIYVQLCKQLTHNPDMYHLFVHCKTE